ncbi:MAG: hypothetical protein ABIP55_14110 [Tepidisphaeraceae bacterium]
MAKKKSDSAPQNTSASKTPAAKSEAPKRTPPPAAKKPAASGAAGDARRIDTSLAANTAAAMVGGKVQLASDSTGGQPRKESAAFKQLKAGLNKPSAGALGGAFGPIGQKKKTITPLGGPKQVGHNQTFGADVNRSGVPRRTPG